mgnify:CR=1 FL=1
MSHCSYAACRMMEFRERLAREGKYDESDWGSCGCFQVEPTPEEVSA